MLGAGSRFLRPNWEPISEGLSSNYTERGLSDVDDFGGYALRMTKLCRWGSPMAGCRFSRVSTSHVDGHDQPQDGKTTSREAARIVELAPLLRSILKSICTTCPFFKDV